MADKMTAEQLVRQKYPDVFEDRIGEWIFIRIERQIIEPSQTYGQGVKTSARRAIGSGGSSSVAWENAAKALELM